MESSSSNKMRFASALTTIADTSQAARQIAEELQTQLGGPANLVVVFFSREHFGAAGKIAARLSEQLGQPVLLGATGEAIVGRGQEIEEGPALSAWAARLPGVELVPMHLEFQRTTEGSAFVGFPDALAADWPTDAKLLLIGEPFSFPADALLERIAEEHPAVLVFGGMASGGHAPGEHKLLLGTQSFTSGAVGLLLSGAVSVRNVVSQGCRPIGRTFVVTKAEQNVIAELSGKPALAQLEEVYRELPTADQKLLERGLHVGRVINEYQETFERGDFLIRNVIGADRETGAIAIGDFARVGQTVQFHVRDAKSADEELRELLVHAGRGAPGHDMGALLFTCNGRGTRLFPEPHHDASVLAECCGDVPVAGLFAQGEIGPIGGKNFLHGFTASIALFEPREKAEAV